jgi:hypothetical protein
MLAALNQQVTMQFDNYDALMFGNPSDFAIEAGLEPGLIAPSQVWGHMCVWCGGVALGNIKDRHCGLHPAFSGFHWLLEHLDKLWNEELAGLDDKAMWNFLDGLLYGYHGDVEIADNRSMDELNADAARYGMFNFLTNWGEQFDGHKAFIVCPPGKAIVRIFGREFPASMGVGTDVSRAGFLAASREFVCWFEEQERRLSSKTPRIRNRFNEPG